MTSSLGAFVVIAAALFVAGLICGFAIGELIRGRKPNPILLVPLGMELLILTIYFGEVTWL